MKKKKKKKTERKKTELVFPDVEGTIATRGNKDVTVLRQMMAAPDGRLVAFGRDGGKAIFRVLCTQVENTELGLEPSCQQLVHRNVFPVKLDRTDLRKKPFEWVCG